MRDWMDMWGVWFMLFSFPLLGFVLALLMEC